MIEFIDKTAEKPGTKINRRNLMAIQGFIDSKTAFNEDGSITEVNADGHTLTTVFNEDGSITETFIGEKTVTKTTKFMSDGTIKEELS